MPRKASTFKEEGSAKPGKKIKKEVTDVLMATDNETSVKKETKRKAKGCEPSTSKAKKIKIEYEDGSEGGRKAFDPDLTKQKEEWLADVENLEPKLARNLVRLFEEDNTIPFIARYRQYLTNGMDAERLRHVKQSFDNVGHIIVKAENLLKTLKKEGVEDAVLTARVTQARTLDEIELLAAPFKKGSKLTKAARAREAGLEEAGMAVLYNPHTVNSAALVDSAIPGREDVDKVRQGLQHIIADVIAKDTSLLEFSETLKKRERITLDVSLKKGAEALATKDKYDLYKEFQEDVRSIKEHQVLAINRGEDKKVLSVKVCFPESFWDQVYKFCQHRWLEKMPPDPERISLFNAAVKDAASRLISPLLTRQIRSRLTEAAERAAISTFSSNLRRLLLSAPVRGRTVLAIDPGAAQGCKVGIVSPLGSPLHTGKIYLTDHAGRIKSQKSITEWVLNYQCDVIAIGNGCYCRETEEFVSSLIQGGAFRPLDVAYVIVDEQGVSIYSCSSEAKKEFSNMDPTLISAISLGRRLQDPLAELVKVDPKHLGVGMYQHDVPEKKLTSSLDEVVSECVSFVGVDLNTASIHLLRRVAGLTSARATAMVARRESEGPFTNRQQILKVKGVGSKSFQQCAGFVRILPATAMTKNLNPFDRTEIHPEDYSCATRVMQGFGLRPEDVGTASFISDITRAVAGTSAAALAEAYAVKTMQMEQLIGALKKLADHDMRTLSQAPLFRRGVTSFESLKPGDVLTGVVRNVVQFGAFVDVGVGTSGLIHSTQLGFDRSRWVQLGDHVRVRVLSVDVHRQRLSLAIDRTN